MADFWQSSGYHLLRKRADGRLVVTDDFLRYYYSRPELAPVAESCAAERALHASLMQDPRRDVAGSEMDAVADPDARENYRVMMRFRGRLLAAETLEAFYFDLFREDVAVPPAFIHHTAQVILRSILDGSEDGLEARAAELFFRKQRVSINDGAIMLADDETVEMHANGGGFGNLGKLLKEGRTSPRTIELDVLDEASGGHYFERDERHDTVLRLNHGQPGCFALARVLEGEFGRTRPGLRLEMISVAPGAQSRGIGRALLAALIARCEAGPWRQMIAVIGDSDNLASIRLHASLGFRHTGTLRAVGFKLGRWVDSVLMQRALGPGGAMPPAAAP